MAAWLLSVGIDAGKTNDGRKPKKKRKKKTLKKPKIIGILRDGSQTRILKAKNTSECVKNRKQESCACQT